MFIRGTFLVLNSLIIGVGFFVFPAFGQEVKDPTRPAYMPPPPSAPEDLSPEERFRVQSILFSPKRKVSIINGDRYQVGDSISDFTVQAIEPKLVTLADAEGEQVEIPIVQTYESRESQRAGDSHPGSAKRSGRNLTGSDSGNWVTLATFEGTGSQTTSDFHVRGRQWRISWDVDGQAREDVVSFSVWAYSDPSGQASKGSGSQDGSGEGQTYIRSGPGTYYLDVSSANASWSVKVEERASR